MEKEESYKQMVTDLEQMLNEGEENKGEEEMQTRIDRK